MKFMRIMFIQNRLVSMM